MKEMRTQRMLIGAIAALIIGWVSAVILMTITYNQTDSDMVRIILVAVTSTVTLKYLNTLSSLRMKLFDMRHREDRRA